MHYRLRPYQTASVDRARDLIRAGKRRILIVAPTGAGKTVIGCAIIDMALERKSRVLFLAHRQELIEQCSKKLDENRIDHGVIRSGHWRDLPHLPVQVASVQTLARRSEMPPADLVITDEAHHVAAGSYLKILDHYPNASSLGLTATPYRTDGKGLGDFYEELVEVTDIPTLIGEGFLVEPVTYAPAVPDLDGVATIAGDYNRKQLASAMDKPKLVGDLVRTWIRYASDRTTVAFAVSVEHSRHIVAEFEACGIAAAHLDGETPEDERNDILARLADGRLQLVSNMGILTEGWDLPRTGCVILARPTQSRGLYFQMVGRGLRTVAGKGNCIVLDHAGCCLRHGHVTDPQEYSLAGVKKKGGPNAASVRTCPQCYLTMPAGTPTCAGCGHVFIAVQRDAMPDQVDGELVLQAPKVYLPHADDDRKRLKYAELVETAAANHYKPGWAAVRFKILFGHMPRPEHTRRDLVHAVLTPTDGAGER